MVSPTPRGNEGWTGAGQLALLLSKITKFTRNLCFSSCIIILANSPHFSSSQPPYHPIFPKHFSMHICKICVFAKYTHFPPTAHSNLQHFIIISQSNSTRMNLLEPHFHIPNHPFSFPLSSQSCVACSQTTGLDCIAHSTSDPPIYTAPFFDDDNKYFDDDDDDDNDDDAEDEDG